MSLDADTIVDRRRMRRKLTFWRVCAIIVAICAVIAIGAALRAPGTDVLVRGAGGSIARVTITGLIRTDLQRVEALERLGKSRARAVIVHINSPGGTTSGSEQLHDSLMRLKEQKPLVVVVDGLAASGGYITAIAADHIVAMETSLVGSIGVLFQYPNVTDLLKTLGVKVEEIKSSPLKAAPNGFEPTSPEARAAISTTRPWSAWPTVASLPVGRASRSSSSTRSATREPRLPGWRRKRTSIRRRRCVTIGCATGSATCRSCTPPWSRPSTPWVWARSRGGWKSGARCRRWSVSTLTVSWPFGTLQSRTRGGAIRSVRPGTAER